MDYLDSFLQEQLEDQEFKAEYEALAPKYQLIETLIAMRLHAGLTQKELAERIGSKQSVISRIERGLETPSLERMRRIAKACGVSLNLEFVYGLNEVEDEQKAMVKAQFAQAHAEVAAARDAELDEGPRRPERVVIAIA